MFKAGLKAALTAMASALCACSLAPPYAAPPAPRIADYKEGGLWTQATPADQLPRGGWWRLFADADLDRLEQQVDAANPTLAGALARYDEASAYLREAQSSLLPNLDAGGSLTRNRQSDNRPLRGANQPNQYDADTLSADVGWELDLWGRVRNRVAAERSLAEADAADLQSVKLSLESDLADDYVRLRGLDNQSALLDQVVQDWTRTLALTERRHSDGLSSKVDVDRARTQLEQAKAQQSETAGRRALLEHAIASLTGAPASTFTLPAKAEPIATPNVPPAIPSRLVQRRPDIAAAERRMAAANSRIGVARAAYFPTIDLLGSAGYQNTGGNSLISAPNAIWGIGPSLALTLFDGGRRKAANAAARAAFDEASAAYRARVLQAFQEVEDSLSLENQLAAEAQSEDAAIAAAREAEALATKRYQRGVTSYLDVVTAQTAALQAEQSGYDLATRRSEASIHLIRAIGGGWNGDGAAARANKGPMAYQD
ncbi:MAG: transporter [Caulobacteraceae bacterium]|nr:transporter [Caulobacteraceae bacterium]